MPERRLAVWVQKDVLAATGNLAAEGDLALRLLPGCSAAGRCAATAAPYLVDGHSVHRWVCMIRQCGVVALPGSHLGNQGSAAASAAACGGS
jgi:hypothetical protein